MNRITILNRIYTPLFCYVILLGACTKKFDQINTDRNTVATVGAAELPFLFSKANYPLQTNTNISSQTIPITQHYYNSKNQYQHSYPNYSISTPLFLKQHSPKQHPYLYFSLNSHLSTNDQSTTTGYTFSSHQQTSNIL